MRHSAWMGSAFLIAGLLAAAPSGKIPEPGISAKPDYYMCFRAAQPPDIDGRLDEQSWKKADWTDPFQDIEGPRKPKPRYKTRAKMLWDENYFYVGAEIEEPHVWATLAERDSVLYEENDFEVFIDPDGDTHNYAEVEINALNTVLDLFLLKPYRDGGPALRAWDIQGLRTAVAVEGTLNDPRDKDKAWTVEAAIPMAILQDCHPGKLPPQPGDQWRVNFSRVEYRVSPGKGGYEKAKDRTAGRPLPEDSWAWAPTGLVNVHYPEMWNIVQFTGTVAGAQKEWCDELPSDPVKWALRKIYYRQRGFQERQGRFSGDLTDLGLGGDKELRVKGWIFPPSIQVTDRLFEAFYKSAEGESWHIRQDGLVWKEEARASKAGE